MGTTERRAREREEMRQRILDAARNLFASEGYEAVTLRKVADCIEYCPATIYKYFQDKDEMVRALCDQDIRDMMAKFQPNLARKTPLERLYSFGLTYIRMGLEQPNHYRLMFMTPLLPQDDPLLAQKKADPETDSYGLFLSVVQQCVDAGVFRPDLADAHFIAQTFWAALHGVISLHIAFGESGEHDWRPVRERAIFMLQLVTEGMMRPGVPTCSIRALADETDACIAA
ncbi:MAG: TetR/AcrR family transcriptional regulator [Burkholderiales bacterium]